MGSGIRLAQVGSRIRDVRSQERRWDLTTRRAGSNGERLTGSARRMTPSRCRRSATGLETSGERKAGPLGTKKGCCSGSK